MTQVTHFGWKAKAIDETRKLTFLFIYLSLLFSALMTLRGLISEQFHVSYFHYGICLIQAAVLAKVIVVGRWFNLGDRFRKKPLIFPALYKTLCFGVFVLLFAIVEHALEGFMRHETARGVVRAILSQGRAQILMRTLVVLIALFPMFAMEEIGRVLGEGKLFELFFVHGPGVADDASSILHQRVRAAE